MCGITGCFGLYNKQLIEDMSDAIKHRGPDEEGYYLDDIKKIMLSHRRLSIIDLSEKGHQPMLYKGKIIIYNGEVYNFNELRTSLIDKGYTFNSNTDTEVILKSYDYWGEKCLEKFNGMFSLAVWDKETDELFCARDRFGIKPFYYYYNSEEEILVFSSEIKSILKYDGVIWEPNDEVIYNYLQFGLVDYSEKTFFKNIIKLSPGHFLRISKNKEIEIKKYWDIKDVINTNNKDRVNCYTNFKNLLDESVKLNLMSDVKLGTALSGGLDSTSIAALINNNLDNSEHQESISYKSSYLEFDESKYIDEFIKYKNINNAQIVKTGGEFWNDIRKLVYYQEEPFISTGMYAGFSVMEMANRLGIKVMLNGQGADEILGGYRKYKIFYIREMLKKGKFLKAVQCLWSVRYQTGKSYNRKDDLEKILNLFRKKSNNYILNYINEEFSDGREYPLNKRKTFIEMLISDIKEGSLPALLRYEDKNSMAWSVEARVPFLDNKLVEYSINLPVEYKMSGQWSKWILRNSMHEDLPISIVFRKDKMGFATEQKIWLEENKDNIFELFNDGKTRSGKYINLTKLNEDLDILLDSKSGFNIWRIINLELWLREFF